MEIVKTHFEQIPTAIVKKIAKLDVEESSSGAIKKAEPKSESDDIDTSLNAELTPGGIGPKKQTADARHKERAYQKIVARIERADARRKMIEKFRRFPE
jgi:hypothetical protein